MISHSPWKIALLSVLCLVPVASVTAQAPAGAATTRTTHDVVNGKGFAIAIPSGWGPTIEMSPTMPLYCGGGDGVSSPIIDEMGSPLQVGMTVEHWPNLRASLDERRKTQADAATKSDRLQLVGQPLVSSITLDDKMPAVLMVFEFIKENERHSLQIKLVANAPDGSAWCASGFLVGGVQSKWPTAKSELAQWLTSYVRSFCFEPGKLDEGKLPGSFVLPAATP
jgi:hypothetical protein